MMKNQNYKSEIKKDGGFGWIVVISAFFIGFITDGLVFSGGILLIELLEHFQQSRAATMSIFSVMVGLMHLVGPFVGALTDRYGCRVVVIIGAVISCVGIVVSTFATSILYICLSYGVLGGLGFGMMYISSGVCVIQHFNKRRTLANGIAVCGSGVGTFVFNQLTRALIDHYTWRGTILIQAGIALQGTVLGLFLVSPESVKAKQYNSASTLKVFTVSIQDRAGHNIEQICVENDKDISCEEETSPRSSKSLSELKLILKSIFDLNLLKDFRCWLFLVAAFTFQLAFPIPFSLIPDQAIETGMTKHQATWLSSSIENEEPSSFSWYLLRHGPEGIANTVSRVFFGLLGDCRCINRMILLQIVLFMSGLSTGLSVLLTSFELKIIYTSLYGFLIGGYITLCSVVLADLFGAEIIAKSFGLFMFFVGVSGFISTPLGGFLFDQTGNYDTTFVVAGAEFIIAALVLLVLKVLSNRIRKH